MENIFNFRGFNTNFHGMYLKSRLFSKMSTFKSLVRPFQCLCRSTVGSQTGEQIGHVYKPGIKI